MHEREAKNVIEPEAEHDQEDDQLVDVSTWCQYDFYSVMPIVKKCLCCTQDSANLLDKMHKEYIYCITEHSNFASICLNKAVFNVLLER